MSAEIYIKLEDGKYEYTFDKGIQMIKRYGQDWRDETGDSVLLAMAQRIQELETGLEDAIYVIEDVVSKNPTTCDSRLTNYLEEFHGE